MWWKQSIKELFSAFSQELLDTLLEVRWRAPIWSSVNVSVTFLPWCSPTFRQIGWIWCFICSTIMVSDWDCLRKRISGEQLTSNRAVRQVWGFLPSISGRREGVRKWWGSRVWALCISLPVVPHLVCLWVQQKEKNESSKTADISSYNLQSFTRLYQGKLSPAAKNVLIINS